MIIDWIYVIVLALFLYKGYRKGAILALFSIVAVLAGIAAAMKLSGTLASLWFEQHPQLARWAPLLIYVLVFLAVVWIVRLLGKALQKSVEFIALGWFNRFLGALLYAILLTMVCSLFLWLLTGMGLLSPETIQASKTYPVLEPFAPRVIEAIGKVIPLFKNSFHELSRLFEHFNRQLQATV